MRRSETIGLLCFAVIGVTALVVGRYAAGAIEDRTRDETRTALNELGFTDVGATVNGSVVALSGSVRSSNDRDVMMARLKGLRSDPELVDNIVVVAPLVDLQPSVLQVQRNGNAITLSGTAPNPEARDLLSAQAALATSDASVANIMDAKGRRANDAWLRASEAAIAAVGKLRAARASVEPGQVRIVGAASDAALKAEIEKTLRGALDDGFKLELKIDSPPPLLSPYVFAANKSERGFTISTCAAPDAAQRSVIFGALRSRKLMKDIKNTDVCIIANGAPNAQWASAVERAIGVLDDLTEGEIRIVDDRVELVGYVPKGGDIQAAVRTASQDWPTSYTLEVDVRDVLPIVSPFTLTAVKMPGDVRLSGHAPSKALSESWSRKLDATNQLELARGAPAEWGLAATIIIEALAQQKLGAATLADRSFRLAAPGDDAERAKLQDQLARRLPEGFRLVVVEAAVPRFMREDAATSAAATVEPTQDGVFAFSAQRKADGAVIIRGQVRDATSKAVVSSYARAKLGGGSFEDQLTLRASSSPDSWQSAILAGLEAMAEVSSGEVVIEPGAIFLRGDASSAAEARRAGAVLASKTPNGFTRFSRIKVIETRPMTEEEKSGPQLSPKECVAALNKEVAENPVRFESGETAVSGESRPVLDALATLMLRCQRVRIEVGGHTDSLGSAEVNATLSRQRAEAVRLSLVARRVGRDRLVAKGYGSAEPTASNNTEAGRIKNRRIEFKLLGSAE